MTLKDNNTKINQGMYCLLFFYKVVLRFPNQHCKLQLYAKLQAITKK